MVKPLYPSHVSFIIHMFALIDLTLFSILFMFLFIRFIIYFDYMISIARLSLCLCISSQSARSKVHRVSGHHCVSVVFICCLSMYAPYILGHVVDCECDILIESFVIHSLNIGQVRPSCEGSQALFFIFLSNVPYM